VAKFVTSRSDEIPGPLAIPTLSGSGAEVTPFATVWDRTAMQKRSLRVRPCTSALIDPLLALTTPKAVRAASALDALAHGADVLWQSGTKHRDQAHATAAIRLVRHSLAQALLGQAVGLTRIAAASVVGGLAIASAGSGPSHALSYPLQLRWQIPHGFGCALGLLWLLRAFPELVPVNLLAALDAADPDGAAREMAALIELAGLSSELPVHGSPDSALVTIAAEADQARLARAGIRIAPEQLAKRLCEVI